MWKELRQLPRKRGAAISAVFFPLLLLLIMPVAQMLALSRVPPDLLTSGRLPAKSSLPAVLALLNRDPAAGFRLLTLPLVVLLGGLVVPSVMASHTIVVERERRTLDLLVALPLTLADVLRAKLATTAVVAIAICLPLFLIDAAVALWLGLAGWADVPALLALLAAALLYSTTGALVISLAAGDFRTANNTAGALTGPLVLVALGLIFVLPPGSATWAMAALLLALAAMILFAALRWLTIERLLR